MTKDSLMELGLTEEQAAKVMESLDGSYVTKTRFNEINTELKAAKATIGERDAQLETLKAAGWSTRRPPISMPLRTKKVTRNWA